MKGKSFLAHWFRGLFSILALVVVRTEQTQEGSAVPWFCFSPVLPGFSLCVCRTPRAPQVAGARGGHARLAARRSERRPRASLPPELQM